MKKSIKKKATFVGVVASLTLAVSSIPMVASAYTASPEQPLPKETCSVKFYRTLPKIALLGVMILAVLSVGILGCQQSKESSEPVSSSGSSDEIITIDGEEYTPKKNIETVLLMGLDKFEDNLVQSGYRNNQQADFLLLLVLDKSNETCTALQLNRDTMVEMDTLSDDGEKDTVTAQLCLAHTYGSGGSDSDINTVKTVSTLLNNQEIDHYIAVPMDVVGEVNDKVGGVTVTIPENMTSINKAWKEGAEIHLTGDNALKYVRAMVELDNSTNLNRMNRNQDYLNKLWEQTKKKYEQDSNSMDDMVIDVATEIDSDCSASKLQKLLQTLTSYGDIKIESTEGTAKQGKVYIEYYVDEDALQKQVAELFYDPVK